MSGIDGLTAWILRVHGDRLRPGRDPAVLEPNERYRRLVELSPDGILITRDTRIVFVNAAAVRLFGAASVDRLLGRVAIELFHPDHHPSIRARIARIVAGETAPLVSEQIVRLDGTVVDVEVTGTLLDPEAGTIQVIVRDISERKRTEDALRESEERLRLAFAGAQEGVWDWNIETGQVVYSDRWKEMLGYRDEEIAPHISAWESLLHPEDRGRAESAQDAVARGETTYQGEFRLRHKNGHYIHVLSRGYPVRREPGGTVVRIVGTHFDLTERKRNEAALRESEERLTLAFAGAQEGVWDWNLETGAVVYSPRWKEMLGYEDDEIEPHVSEWERLLHPDDLARAKEVHDAVMHGAPTYEGEFRLRHKDGHYVQVLSRGFPVRRDPGGPVVRIVGTHFDLTARKRAEAERARSELLGRLVFAQEDERKRIAREMHDQFGEHLTALGHGIARLKDACAQHPALRSEVEGLESIAQRLDRDVDHLVWDLRPTALDDLGLRAALTNYVNTWSARVGIAARLHTSGLWDHRLAADAETALYRIAQEALNNVAKHSRASNVEVILERRPGHVVLIIEDDGVGFERESGTGTSDRGFGLLGMQERAALVGASLEIESSAGQGTTILVRMSSTTPTDVAAHA
jgi:PAS domain S-box-containing protein